ncbi:MAG: hypothetical protein QM754_12040 [Tepidisphaeraceae bacterium]
MSQSITGLEFASLSAEVQNLSLKLGELKAAEEKASPERVKRLRTLRERASLQQRRIAQAAESFGLTGAEVLSAANALLADPASGFDDFQLPPVENQQ